MGAFAIHYYPSVEEQRALMHRHLRSRMYAFLAVIVGSTVLDALAVWWIVEAF